MLSFDYDQKITQRILLKLKFFEQVLIKNEVEFPDDAITEDINVCKQIIRIILALSAFLEVPCDQNTDFLDYRTSVCKLKIRCDMKIQSLMPMGILELLKWIKYLTLSDPRELDKTIDNKIQTLRSKVDQITFSTKERRMLINESIRLLIPVTRLHQQYFLFGIGAKGVQFDYSLTKNTSVIAAKMVRNKFISDTMLAMAALPRPIAARAFSKEGCYDFAKKHGFPLVIKPADLDTGRGVFSEICSLEQLDQGFDYAMSFSKNVLIQKHVSGKEYRLFVLNGELVWCFERLYPTVIGDGQSSVKQLIEVENKRPLRIKENILIKINSEVARELDRQGLILNSVPAFDEIVRVNSLRTTQVGGLHSAANDKIHPDNKVLVERAAKIFDIDFCGVDLIISDIRTSWQKTISAVLEINSQPQISYTAHHLYGLLLKTFVKDKGRVPIIIVCGQPREDDFLEELIVNLESTNKRAAIINDGKTNLNRDSIFADSTNEETAIKALKIEKNVDLIILFATANHRFSKRGFYWDSFDGLIIEQENVNLDKCDYEFLANFCFGEVAMNKLIDKSTFKTLKANETFGSLSGYLKNKIKILTDRS